MNELTGIILGVSVIAYSLGLLTMAIIIRIVDGY